MAARRRPRTSTTPSKSRSQPRPVSFHETNGDSTTVYTIEGSASSAPVLREKRPDGELRASVRRFFSDCFLPEGYPASVTPDYLTYQFWDTVQAVCSYLSGILCQRAMLKGVGVGDATATATSATLQWIFKDGAGMVGRICFTWAQGTSLDSNAKAWRLTADVLNDFAMAIELMVPYYPDAFLLIACLSSVARSIVGVAGGATRAALTQHFALRNNLADVSAKDGSQETAVNLIGMLAGAALTYVLNVDDSAIWLIFFVMTCMHIYANYAGLRACVLDTPNVQRATILMDHYCTSTSNTL